jgi:predicted transcriptional regulator of viral defense system
MNRLFLEIYPKKLFSLGDANKIIKDYQICRNNITRLVKNKSIQRLKGGLYYIIPLDNPNFYPDTIHIGSKLRVNGIISANSALKLLKLQTKDEDIVYLSAKHPSKMRIDKHTYKIIKNYNFGIDEVEYATTYGTVEIKVTDIERTIIDCLRIRSIKIEELVNILKSKNPELSMRKIINYLEKYNMPILYNKVGLVLELCKTNLKIDNADLEKLRKKLTKKIYYFKERGIKLIRPKYHYLKEWNIMLPEHLFEIAKVLKPATTQVTK